MKATERVKFLREEIISLQKKEYPLGSSKSCVLCGDCKDLEKHHLIPRRYNGSDDKTNLIVLCHYCHWYLHANPKLRCYHSDLIRNSMITGENGKKYSYKGNLWGKPSIKDSIKKEIINLRNEGKSLREISKIVYYLTKTNNKKFVSIGYIHKVLQNIKSSSDFIGDKVHFDTNLRGLT